MKKYLAIMLALPMLLLFFGCMEKTTTTSTTNTTPTTGTPAMNNTSKSLVVCFSATGTTRGVATRLAEAIGADYFEIVPVQPYTSADLNWRDKESRSSIEMGDRASRPAIANAVSNLSDYATVFIGFPIWWGREPSIIDTFVETNAAALAGKTIVPFATSGSSGIGNSGANLQALAPNAKVTEGRRFAASVDADTLKAWAASATE